LSTVVILLSIRLKDYRKSQPSLCAASSKFSFSTPRSQRTSAFGQPSAISREQIVEASNIAHWRTEFINGFADGYDTIVG